MDSSFLNRQTLWWFNPIPAKGIKKPLVIDDLFELNDISQSRYLVPKWHQLWDKAMRGIVLIKQSQVLYNFKYLFV
jgi:hypothetical protein